MSHLLNAYYVPGSISALNILSYLILTVPQQGCYYFHFTAKRLYFMMVLKLAQGYTAGKQLDFEYRGLDSRTDFGIKGESPLLHTVESYCF